MALNNVYYQHNTPGVAVASKAGQFPSSEDPFNQFVAREDRTLPSYNRNKTPGISANNINQGNSNGAAIQPQAIDNTIINSGIGNGSNGALSNNQNALSQNQVSAEWANRNAWQMQANAVSAQNNSAAMHLGNNAQSENLQRGLSNNRSAPNTQSTFYSNNNVRNLNAPTNPDENYAGSNASVNYSTADNLGALMNKSNPLVKMARTRAAQQANSRGLLNSSLAAEAGEQAAMEMMLPVAQADAETFNRRWLEQKRIEAEAKLAKEERDSRQKMFESEQSRHVYSAVNNADSVYSQMFSNIVNNPNYSAGDRANLFRHISLIRDSSYKQINAIYGTDLTWQTAVNA